MSHNDTVFDSVPYTPKLCRRIVQNERGTALIIAISLLAIMSILGVIMMSTTSTEIKLSGNKRNQQEAFNAADRAIEYAMQNATETVATINLYNDADTDGTLHRTRITVENSGLENPAVSGMPDANTVAYIGSGPPPPEFASDAGEFQANYYVITVVGASPVNSPNPSRAVIRTQVAKIVPK